MVKRSAVTAIGLLLGLGSIGSAQVGISVRAGTLGVGGEISYRPNRYLGLRAGGNYFTVTRNATIEGIAYQVQPKLQNGTALVDLHPLGGSFHLSGGVVWNSNQGAVAAELTGPVTIGPTTYQPGEVGALTGVVKYQDRYAPYAGLGFGGRGRVSFLFDVGLVFSGFPQVSLTGSTNLTGQAKAVFDQNVQQEIQEIQTQIESRKYLKYTPVISLGLRVGL
jgi:hypothetical protein